MAGSQVEGLVFGRKPLSTLKPVRLSANPGIPGSMTCNENGLRRFHRKSEWSSKISVANEFGDCGDLMIFSNSKAGKLGFWQEGPSQCWHYSPKIVNQISMKLLSMILKVYLFLYF